MIESLYNRHHVTGLTGSFHGDMADAFAKVLADLDCDAVTRQKIATSIRSHKSVESSRTYSGRKWFTEKFTGGV